MAHWLSAVHGVPGLNDPLIKETNTNAKYEMRKAKLQAKTKKRKRQAKSEK